MHNKGIGNVICCANKSTTKKPPPPTTTLHTLFLGIFFVLPCIETYQKVDLRTITLDVPPQEVSNQPAFSPLDTVNIPGPDERFGDSVSGRSGLLPGVERDDLGGERGERPPFYKAAGPDDPEEHPWDKTLARNTQ